jgi:hypothetical protein
MDEWIAEMGKVVEDTVESGVLLATTDALGKRGPHLALCVEARSHSVAARKAAASSFKTESECYRYDDVVDARSSVASRDSRHIQRRESSFNVVGPRPFRCASLKGEHREELSR